MNEVYDVCQRLKTAGFPQDNPCLQFYSESGHLCGAYERAHIVADDGDTRQFIEGTSDPDQAMRLVLAAALEADNAK